MSDRRSVSTFFSYTPRAMAIDIDITHVARLARLGLSEDELATYEASLERFSSTPLGYKVSDRMTAPKSPIPSG